MANSADKTKPYFHPTGLVTDGYSRDGEATATCFCGKVQLAFPTEAPGFVNSFVCHCSDCHKIHSSMLGANITIRDSHLKHIRGRELLKTFGLSKHIASGEKMTNHFCSECGTLMYRVGEHFPGVSILRLGTVDDFNLAETKLRPTTEHFTKNRVGWLSELKGVKHFEGPGYDVKNRLNLEKGNL
ncbi:Mss4-like protein [Chaetomium sp. MPI-SDFR-AT-0129]|nr:Mss4-like protein [Chaetomium sp. MPI-SDFR-AT-0129]